MNKEEIQKQIENIIDKEIEVFPFDVAEAPFSFSQIVAEKAFNLAFNLALDLAAENALIEEKELETESYIKADRFAEGKSYSYTTDMDGYLLGVNTFEIDKESILKLKL